MNWLRYLWLRLFGPRVSSVTDLAGNTYTFVCAGYEEGVYSVTWESNGIYVTASFK